ncbi:MAG: class I SAM-dependent methyltransferase, partial [Rhodothermia bacterium]|nr:class I SAM-dependent methyltransferase [Rhodothermia bacterium]
MTAPSKVPATPRHQHTFYEARSVPIHNVRLIRSREAALAYPTGDIVLSIDENSGLIQNIAFEPDKVLYDEEYEETQGFSQTFQEFQKQLAQSLIERHDLTNKRILEIGCGKGEFISLMCELGDNEGVGFDPAFIERRNPDPTNRVTFFSEFFTEKHTASSYDLVCCKMTLEHIHRPNLFMRMLRRAIGNAVLPVVFFQVPNSLTIFRDTAFWDIYYEHCNYFSAGSLGRLFQTNGFRVDRIWTDYHDQYLMVEARPAPDRPGEQATAE